MLSVLRSVKGQSRDGRGVMVVVVALGLMSPAVCGGLLAQGIPGVAPPDHVVLVIEENQAFQQIIGSPSAPYINSLSDQGALMTQSFAIGHPSEPNYLELFSGSNQGVTDDSCPHTFSAENLGSELLAAGLTFSGYSEDLPSVGDSVCMSGAYARKHNPWSNFTNVPNVANRPFSNFPSDFTALPTLSIVIPNLNNDMHDGTISEGDTWLQQNLDSYVQFAKTHKSLLVLTWDEDDDSHGNQIATIFVGPMVKNGRFSERITHYDVLRTLEDLYGLTHAANAAGATPITDIWRTALRPDFGISVTSSSQTVTAGGSASTTVTITPSGGFAGTVDLTVSGLPSGAAGTFNPASMSGGSGSSTVSISTSGSTPAGTYMVTLTGTSGSLSHSTTVSLTVNPVSNPDFLISVTPASQTVTAGENTSYRGTLTPLNGFTGAVNLTCSGAPASSACTVPILTVSGPSPATFTVNVVTTARAPAAPYALRDPRGRTPQQPFLPFSSVFSLLAVVMLTAVIARRFESFRIMMPAGILLACFVMLLSACGSGGANTPPPGGGNSSGTPTGTYTLVVTGAQQGITHAANITLNVK